MSTSSTNFVFFGPIGKTRWPPWPLIGRDIFDFSENAERNSMKLDRKQDLNVLYQVCVFRADRKNKMAALANPPRRWHIVLGCTICGPLGLLLTSCSLWYPYVKKLHRVSYLAYGSGSSGGRVVKLFACGARGPGLDSRPRHLNFQRLVISCFQVEIWLKER